MAAGNDETREYTSSLVAADIEATRLTEMRQQKRELIQRRDQLSKLAADDAVHIDVGGTIFKLSYAEARRVLVKQLESVEKGIEAVESSLQRHKRDTQQAPDWVRGHIAVPAGLPWASKGSQPSASVQLDIVPPLPQ